MQIVISFERMVGFGGTETYVLTIASALERLGHEVVIHAQETGPCAEFARAHGARVIELESQLPPRCDAVFAQDAATAYTMASLYPDAARVFVAHSAAFPLQTPPQLDNVCQAVVTMNERLRRRSEQLARHPRVVRLRQPIDLQRFCFRATNLEQRKPPRVLWLNNYPGSTRQRMIERACEQAGLELRQTGAASTPTATPEHEIAAAEIVISLGRGALEAMASGRAAYVYGVAGGDGWVTADSYPALERDGFSGRAFGHAAGFEQLARDLSAWSEELGETGRELACTHHDADEHAVELVELLERLDASPAKPPRAARELGRLVRLEWDRGMQARAAAAEAAALRSELSRTREALGSAQASAAQFERKLDQVRASRRYRLASWLAWPLEQLRARR